MKKVHERVYKIVRDIITVPRELNALAGQCKDEGYQVNRGAAGTVILKLDDGEVHFVPVGQQIKQIVFAY